MRLTPNFGTYEKYLILLHVHLITFGILLGGAKCVFQQDNASSLATKFTKEWIKILKVDALQSPNQSPDLISMENL